MLTIEPRHFDGTLLLANAADGLKEYDSAIVLLQEAITQQPAKGELYANLAAMQMAAGRQDEAERSRVTGLAKRRIPYWIDYSAKEQSRRRGAFKGGATRALQRAEAKR